MAGLILQPMPATSYWTDSNNDGVPEEVADPPEGDAWWSDDSDGDNLTNAEEAAFLSDPYRLDSDFDGLTDKDERDLTPPVLFGGLAHTDPWDWDSDDDGYSDHDEYFYTLQNRSPDVHYPSLAGGAFYSYYDADGDGLHNQDDSQPVTMDRDGDGILNWQDSYMDDPWNGAGDPNPGPPADSDADGIPNESDPFPWGSYSYAGVEYGGSWVDSDGDLIPDPADPFPNGSFSYNGTEYGGNWSDRDNDSIPDLADTFPDGSYFWNGLEYPGHWVDQDGDDIPDAHDAFPTLSGSYFYGGTEYGGTWTDSDLDGIPDPADAFPNGSYWYNGVEYPGTWSDQDNDGIPDSADAWPADPTQGTGWQYNGQWYTGAWVDRDNDGVPDPADSWPDDPENGLDSDGDGLDNYTERTVTHTDPSDVDSDNDFLGDGEEALITHSNPSDPTTGDAQTLLDFYVFSGPDSDADGLPDFVEKHYAEDRLSSNAATWLDSQGDLDGDGVKNLSAYSFGWDLRANARQYDLDGDGMTDAQEDYWAGRVPGLLNKAVFSDAVADPDGDGLLNFEEVRAGLAPNNAVTPMPDGTVPTVRWWKTVLEDDGNGGQQEVWQVDFAATAGDYERLRGPLNYHTSTGLDGQPVTTDDSAQFTQLGPWAVPVRLAAGDWDADGMPDVWEHRHGLALRDATDAGPATGLMPSAPTAPEYAPPPAPVQADFMVDVTDPVTSEVSRVLDQAAYDSAVGAWNAAKAEYDQAHAASMAAHQLACAQWQSQDPDGDRLSNLREHFLGTHPRISDSDGDGIDDGLEQQHQTNPLSRNDLPPIVLTIAGGDGQSVTAGQPLPSPLMVTATQAGLPRENIPITFSVASGGGTFTGGGTSKTVTTAPGGMASTGFTTGPTAGTTSVSATAGTTPVSFTVTTQAPTQPNPGPTNPGPGPGGPGPGPGSPAPANAEPAPALPNFRLQEKRHMTDQEKDSHPGNSKQVELALVGYGGWVKIIDPFGGNSGTRRWVQTERSYHGEPVISE